MDKKRNLRISNKESRVNFVDIGRRAPVRGAEAQAARGAEAQAAHAAVGPGAERRHRAQQRRRRRPVALYVTLI